MVDKEKPKRIQIDIGGIRDILETLAKAERRSLAAQIRVLIEEALQARGVWKTNAIPIPPAGPSTLAELVEVNWDKLVASAISPNCLKAYKTGRQPTEIDLLRIAMSLDMSEDEIRAIYARSFPNNQEHKEKQVNGV